MALSIPEYSGISLHGLLHLQTDLGGVEGAIRVPDLIEELDALNTGLFGNLFVGFARCHVFLYVDCTSTAEDDDIKQGVGSKAVGSVDGYASSFACSIKSRDNLILAVLIDGQNFTREFSRNAAHWSSSLKGSQAQVAELTVVVDSR